MNKHILSLSLLALTFGANAMDSGSSKNCITLPSQEVLRKRLAEQGFGEFMEKTKIDVTLADKKLGPLGVGMAVEYAMFDFMKNETVLMFRRMRKHELIRCILQDHPQAVKELKELGLLG